MFLLIAASLLASRFSIMFLTASLLAALGFTLAGTAWTRFGSLVVSALALLCGAWIFWLSYDNYFSRETQWPAAMVLAGIFSVVPAIGAVLALWRVFSPEPFRDRRWVLLYSFTMMAAFVAYSNNASKRKWGRSSKSTAILEEVRLIDGAKDQYAIENSPLGTVEDLFPYLKTGSQQTEGLQAPPEGPDSWPKVPPIGPLSEPPPVPQLPPGPVPPSQ